MNISDAVALLEPIPEANILRGQIGNIVDALDTGFFEVKFRVGEDYTTLAVPEKSLIPFTIHPVQRAKPHEHHK